MKSKTLKKRIKTRRLLVALLLLGLMLTSGLVVSLASDDTGTDPGIAGKNAQPVTYALVISTGDYSTISYEGGKPYFFSVEYTYVNPVTGTQAKGTAVIDLTSDYKHSLEMSVATGKGSGVNDASLDTVLRTANTTTGFVSSFYNLSDKTFNSQLTAIGKPYSVDTFYFTAPAEILSVDGISVCGSAGLEWDLETADVYKVDEIGRVSMLGFVSDSAYLSFTGTQIASGKPKNSNKQITFTKDSVESLSVTDYLTEKQKAYAKTMKEFTSEDCYLINLSLAETYDSGNNALYTIKKGNITDSLTAAVQYYDSQARLLTVKIPVLSNALTYYTLRKTIPSVFSYFGDGSDIGLYAYLPDCASVYSVTLFYSDSAVQEIEKGISIAGIQVYRGDVANQYVGLDTSYMSLRYDYSTVLSAKNTEDMLLYYWCSSEVAGRTILNGDTTGSKFELSQYVRGNVLPQEDRQGLYLVTLKTGENDTSTGISDPIIGFTYKNLKDELVSTEKYKLSDLAKEYYYCMNRTEGEEYLPLVYGMSKGNSVSFVVEINNLKAFTEMTLELERGNNAKTDWNLQSVTIQSIDSLDDYYDKRISATYEGTTFDRAVTRKAVNASQMEYTDINMIVQKGDEVTIPFTSSSENTSVSTDVRNDLDNYYSMTYADAVNTKNFTEVACTYSVVVHVSSNINAGTDGDTCGSSNLFYFQLVFENGKSAYVLANNQISADSFGAGEDTTFDISVNEDFGDVTAINIIPGDQGIDSNSNVLDKLNISSIDVIKSLPNGINVTYTAPEVGWIVPSYRESASDTTSYATEGRTAGSLVHSYAITQKSYGLRLEIGITTGEYIKQETTYIQQTDGTYREKQLSYASQLEGNMTMTLYYTNTDGESCHTEYPVVSKMYDYLNHDPKKEDGKLISDSSIMFREQHTDRFQIDIEDVKSIEAITLTATSDDVTYWKCKCLTVDLITSDGYLQKNANNEYQRKYTEDPERICEVTNDFALYIAGGGSEASMTLYFDENTIPTVDSEETVLSAVTRTPSSQYDFLNIYAYLPDGVSPAKDNTSASAVLTYSLTTSGTRLHKITPLLHETTTEDGRTLLYALGVDASGFNTLSDFSLKSTSGKTYYAASEVIIQHIRNNVIVETLNQSGNSTSVTSEQQQVVLSVGDGTVSRTIHEMNYDVAVCFQYTSSQDVAKEGTKYWSPYVYLSDMGYTTVGQNSELVLTYDCSYVDEITGIMILPIGGFEIDLDNVTVTAYSTDAAGEIVRGNDACYLNIGQVSKTGYTASTDSAAPDYSIPVTVTVQNSAGAGTVATLSGSNAYLTFTYLDKDGVDQEKTVSIKKSLLKGSSLADDSESTFIVGLANLSRITKLTLSVADGDGDSSTTTWNADAVTLTYKDRYGANHTIEAAGAMYITENGGVTITVDSDENANVLQSVQPVQPDNNDSVLKFTDSVPEFTDPVLTLNDPVPELIGDLSTKTDLGTDTDLKQSL